MPYLELFSKAAFIVGILFAAAVPLITDMTYVMSIRRGSMLIIAAVPISALAALPMYSLAGLSRAAEYGVYIKNTASLENTGDLASVIYDKADVLQMVRPSLFLSILRYLITKVFSSLPHTLHIHPSSALLRR